MKLPLTLYRADCTEKENKTYPEHYACSGLMSKQINGGLLAAHKEYGWVATIVNHVASSLTKQGVFLHEKTPLLSFTTDIKRAEFFLSRGDSYTIHHATRADANVNAFIFKAIFDKLEQDNKLAGVYHYQNYRCNYNRTDPNFFSLLSNYCRCQNCSNTPNYKHNLLVINAEEYLSMLINSCSSKKQEYEKAYKYAKCDSEWLLMPLDQTKGLNGNFSSRIPVADFWDVERFAFIKKKETVASTN